MSQAAVTGGVFARTEVQSAGKRISENAYNLIIGLTLCWGFAVNWWMVGNIPLSTLAGINRWVLILGYFASCFLAPIRE